jgi:Protein of unknown function (DUF2917)
MQHIHHSGFSSFALHAGRALSLKPTVPSQLRITQGSAWVTLPSLPGDHFLRAGDTLQVRARDAMVIEAWHMPQGQTLYFDWDPVPMHVPAAASAPTSAPKLGSWLHAAAPSQSRPSYCAAVLEPLADLRLAAVLGAGAAARLTAGLLCFALGKLVDASVFLVAALMAASRARSSTA